MFVLVLSVMFVVVSVKLVSTSEERKKLNVFYSFGFDTSPRVGTLSHNAETLAAVTSFLSAVLFHRQISSTNTDPGGLVG